MVPRHFVDEGGRVLTKHCNVGDAFNCLDKRSGIGGEFVGVGESASGGIDVNHGHKSLLRKSVK